MPTPNELLRFWTVANLSLMAAMSLKEAAGAVNLPPEPLGTVFRAALATYGAPDQALTDNGKVFTGRYNHPPVEVLFDAICREHGIEHLLTQPRSPAATLSLDVFDLPAPESRIVSESLTSA